MHQKKVSTKVTIATTPMQQVTKSIHRDWTVQYLVKYNALTTANLPELATRAQRSALHKLKYCN